MLSKRHGETSLLLNDDRFNRGSLREVSISATALRIEGARGIKIFIQANRMFAIVNR